MGGGGSCTQVVRGANNRDFVPGLCVGWVVGCLPPTPVSTTRPHMIWSTPHSSPVCVGGVGRPGGGVWWQQGGLSWCVLVFW